MHKMTIEASSAINTKKGRLLARVLAEDLRRVQGQNLRPYLASVVTGEVRRDWSSADEDGLPLL